jgi:hypothetical protein
MFNKLRLRYMQKRTYLRLKYPLFVSIIRQNWNESIHVTKDLQDHVHENRFSDSRIVSCVKTDRQTQRIYQALIRVVKASKDEMHILRQSTLSLLGFTVFETIKQKWMKAPELSHHPHSS